MDRRPAFPCDFELLLASQSPRRHELLSVNGVPFRVIESEAEEVFSGDGPASIAEANALAKWRGAVLPEDASAEAFVLTADTIVAVDGRVMGKAASEREAAEMLAALSGRTHQVVSGVALGRAGGTPAPARAAGRPAGPGRAAPQSEATARPAVRSAVTDVTFIPLADEDIAAYLASDEWRGKAGAYAVQGLAGLYVAGIRGEYSNVVGLPLALLARMFRDQGFDLVRRTWV